MIDPPIKPQVCLEPTCRSPVWCPPRPWGSGRTDWAVGVCSSGVTWRWQGCHSTPWNLLPQWSSDPCCNQNVHAYCVSPLGTIISHFMITCVTFSLHCLIGYKINPISQLTFNAKSALSHWVQSHFWINSQSVLSHWVKKSNLRVNTKFTLSHWVQYKFHFWMNPQCVLSHWI